VIVFADADLELAIQTIKIFGYYNAGQDCTAPCHVYAHDAIYDRFVADLAAAVAGIRVGSQTDPDVEMGPCISERQRNRVASFVERAKHEPHIRVVCGGNPIKRRGYFYEPTVIANARQTDEIARSEVFGPVVSITRFSDTSEVIAMANDSEYGLASSVLVAEISARRCR